MPPLSRSSKQQIFNFVLLGCFWAVLFSQLWYEWNNNEQYGYGVFMPFIGLYLMYARWLDRPNTSNCSGRTMMLVCIGFAILLLYPIKIIFEANADWRFIAWVQAMVTLGVSFIIIAYWGGWSWVCHFSLPLIFFLFGVPWPTAFEVFIINKLLTFVTFATVEIVNLIGVLAIASGNLIHLTTGIVSMEEACSGVRSFQSSVMLGFFLGELFRFGVFKRIFLLVAGGFFAMLFNIGRTTSITLVAAKKSIEETLKWHDFAGNAVFICCLVSLIIVAFVLKRKDQQALPLDAVKATSRNTPTLIGLKVAFVGSCLLILSELFIYGWFHWRPPLPYEGYSWAIDWDKVEGIKEEDMAYGIQDALIYDEGRFASWKTHGRYDWLAYYFKWNHPKGAQLAGFHGPDLCLPATGWAILETGEPIVWTQDDVRLVFTAFSFVNTGKLVYIFYCQWDQSNYPYYVKEGTMRMDRLISAWSGHLKKGKIVLEVIVSGMNSLEQARTAFSEFLETHLVVSRG